MRDRVYVIVEHMIDDARDAIDFAKQAGSFEVFSQNPLYCKAIIMSIINLGELTKQLPDDFKSAHSDIPWRQISGMRDVVVHGYHRIDKEKAWNTINSSIPKLLTFLEKFIEDNNNGSPS
jgi:uncharacterized protein with HEPN domain